MPKAYWIAHVTVTDDAAYGRYAALATKAIAAHGGEFLVRGGTDGSRLSELGLPTPNVFNGGHDYHSRFEWNTVQNLELSLAYLEQLVSYWARHGAA